MIENHIKKYLSCLDRESEQYHWFVHRVYDNLAEYVLRRGRRLASTSTLIIYLGYKGKIDEHILRACSAIELYRHSILLHDDLVDKEDLRRGGKVFHHLFNNYDEEMGKGVAIFAGNIAYVLAVQNLFSSGFQRSKLERAAELMNADFLAVNESQMLDLLFEYETPDVEEWYIMASKKAASLFKTTILIGAMLGDAPEDDIPILTQAAENIGYSFDIQDDIIDTFAAKEQYGRKPAGDITRGKKPLHIVYTLKMANNDALKMLKSIKSKGFISKNDLDIVRQIIRSCGALGAAKERSRYHTEQAIDLMERLKITQESKDFFKSLMKFVESSLDWYK